MGKICYQTKKKLEMNHSKLDIQNKNQKSRRKRRENISERGEGLKDIKKKKRRMRGKWSQTNPADEGGQRV